MNFKITNTLHLSLDEIEKEIKPLLNHYSLDSENIDVFNDETPNIFGIDLRPSNYVEFDVKFHNPSDLIGEIKSYFTQIFKEIINPNGIEVTCVNDDKEGFLFFAVTISCITNSLILY